ncbi:MAG: alpha/beta hydrolase [Pseudomonadota bacterium]
MNSSALTSTTSVQQLAQSRAAKWVGGLALLGIGSALWVRSRARRAERQNPPRGRFIDVDGVRLHYVDRGTGPAVVLLHGNTVSSADFQASGLIEGLAQRHRVLAFDRPGFGHSGRPRGRLWTPAAQAKVIHQALEALAVREPVVVAHSMGTQVALAMALAHPTYASRLVLMGGYYYPSLRADVLLTAPAALPVVGDAMRYTVTALSARALLPVTVKGMFSPQPVPSEFFPVLSREMLLRPWQLRANAEDAAFMVPAAKSMQEQYKTLQHLPITLIAGDADKVVDLQANSLRLHQTLPQSQLWVVEGAGHMAHYADPEAVIAAVEGRPSHLQPASSSTASTTQQPEQVA